MTSKGYAASLGDFWSGFVHHLAGPEFGLRHFYMAPGGDCDLNFILSPVSECFQESLSL